ncbi:hypothetical protein LLE49_07685 [Alicyclobacillus tolerans]|uniref:hypothetical protein n=1 Tax=Alicyclobacillus tolerans TaxID=90970 RepID=UPI001F280790|nr:hypothetical protein [Alicyclobacillus tolerans]MCF8564625.1 hypothetical protein [Alicyclobacillus tolerans]
MRGLLFPLSGVFLILTGCGSVPKATVTPTQATFRMPKVTDINSLNIESDYPSRATLLPNDPKTAIKNVLTMLQAAQPVSVQFPHSKKKLSGESSGYTGPATLNLHLNASEDLMITPAYFIWSAWQGGFDYHYVNGVVEYREDESVIYLRDVSLYNWLKQDRWKSQFHMPGQNH